MRVLIGVLLSYVVGSIPWAWIAGKLLKGIDLRRHGSGNLGATNVYRTLGLPAALTVLFLDFAKGAISALFIPSVVGVENELMKAGCGLAAVVGHMWPLFFLVTRQGGGGKGVATAAGVFAVLAPLPLLLSLLVFTVVVARWRYVSLGSLAAASAFPVAAAGIQGTGDPIFPVALVVAALVWWRHRGNLRRLVQGTEPKLIWPARG
jgi:glycerol-3-phosphate acyltransferase PlsY